MGNTYSDEPYVVITADSHAGASHATYREYLDPEFRDRFDEFRSGRKSGMLPLQSKKHKNWETEVRLKDLDDDGTCGEIIFPNTVPPFYPAAFHLSPPPRPEVYELQLAGARAHNRWLKDFCDEAPERRAGIALMHLNDIDDAIKTVEWVAKEGLRGGVLLPSPPDDMWNVVAPLMSREYDRLWAAIQDHDITVNQHSGGGAPDYGKHPGSMALWFNEMMFFSQRNFKSLIWGGVFERFPRLRFIVTEAGCDWVMPVLNEMDGIWRSMKRGNAGELHFDDADVLPEAPSFYAKRNCYYGASFPGRKEIDGRYELGLEHVLWGSDYPHLEGTFPDSRMAMRVAFHDLPEGEVRAMLGGNAAKLYNFDMNALKPLAARLGVMPRDVARPLGADEIPEDVRAPLLLKTRKELRGEEYEVVGLH